MGRERGWVAVSVRTYHSHRSSQQQQPRVLQQDYTVDETGATLNAVSRSSDIREEERMMAQLSAASSSSTPTTSIFIRDWKVRRAPRALSLSHLSSGLCTSPGGLARSLSLRLPASSPRVCR